MTPYNQFTAHMKKCLLETEEDLTLWEQIEITLIQPAPVLMEDIWLNYMLQLGFIIFFSMTFPLAPLIGLVFNLIDMEFVFFSYSYVFRRIDIVELDSIGVWNEVIHGMTIVSLVVNVGLFVFCSDGFKKLLNIDDKYDLLLFLVLYEHIVFLLKWIASHMVQLRPRWIRQAIDSRRKKNQLYNESDKKTEFKKKAAGFGNYSNQLAAGISYMAQGNLTQILKKDFVQQDDAKQKNRQNLPELQVPDISVNPSDSRMSIPKQRISNSLLGMLTAGSSRGTVFSKRKTSLEPNYELTVNEGVIEEVPEELMVIPSNQNLEDEEEQEELIRGSNSQSQTGFLRTFLNRRMVRMRSVKEEQSSGIKDDDSLNEGLLGNM